ncbi:hypothetical protein VZT92_018040 [Zoarces viviparus]|uniref:Uncharacterized protein n=1 Tax=Zoarces viviparus TaxID=48416 RepID=A0AAW1EN59_ZOAVI
MLEFSEGLTDPPFSHQPQLIAIARSRVQSVAAAGNRDPRRLRKQRESTNKHDTSHGHTLDCAQLRTLQPITSCSLTHQTQRHRPAGVFKDYTPPLCPLC